MRALDLVTIGGVRMPRSAGEVVEWAGVDPAVDVARLRDGQVTEAALVAECEDDCDDDETRSAWREYVIAVALAAEVRS